MTIEYHYKNRFEQLFNFIIEFLNSNKYWLSNKNYQLVRTGWLQD